MSSQLLMRRLAFDEQDLRANRIGRLSERQRRRLEERNRSSRNSALRSGIGLLLLGIAGPIAALIASIRTGELAVMVSFGIPFGVIWPVIWIGIGWRTLTPLAASDALTLTSARGQAQIKRYAVPSDGDQQGALTEIELRIADQIFDIEPRVAGAFTGGDEYVVYYLGETNEILSVDELTAVPARS